MTIHVNVKQLKKRLNQVAACPYELKQTPATLRELITMLVLEGVADYNSRLRRKEPGKVLSQDAIDDMTRIGKIGFGVPFGSREADGEEAVAAAIQGFEDGLYRFFVNDGEIESLDAPLALQDGDAVTIIRLVMLTGGFFW